MFMRKGFTVFAVVLCSAAICLCAAVVGSIWSQASELVTGLMSIF